MCFLCIGVYAFAKNKDMNKEMMNNIVYYTNENKVTFTKEIVLKDYKEPYCENINGQKYCYQENEKS